MQTEDILLDGAGDLSEVAAEVPPKPEPEPVLEPVPEPEPELEYEPEPIEDCLETEKLRLKLASYLERFPDRLGGIDVDIAKLNRVEIEQVLQSIKVRMSLTSNFSMLRSGLTYTIAGTEMITRKWGLKTEGMTAAALQEKALNDIMDEIALEYSTAVSVHPIAKFGLHLAAIVKTVDAANRLREARNAKADQQAKEQAAKQKAESVKKAFGSKKQDIDEKYKDI